MLLHILLMVRFTLPRTFWVGRVQCNTFQRGVRILHSTSTTHRSLSTPCSQFLSSSMENSLYLFHPPRTKIPNHCLSSQSRNRKKDILPSIAIIVIRNSLFQASYCPRILRLLSAASPVVSVHLRHLKRLFDSVCSYCTQFLCSLF